MQIKKEEVKDRIISSGKELFKKQGFRNTSMRQVAKKSEVSVANIYNYFKDKEELFRYIVRNAIESYENLILERYSKEIWADEKVWTLESEVEKFNEFIDIFYQYKDEFILLFCKSEGSKFANYPTKMLERHYKLSEKVNEYIYPGEKHFLKKKIPEFIVRNCVKMYMEIIVEGLSLGLDKIEMKKRVKEYTYFLFYGYKGYFVD